MAVFISNNAKAAENVTDNSTSAELTEVVSPLTKSEEDDFFIDARIQKELKNSIQNVYGQDIAQDVYDNLIKHAKTALITDHKNLNNKI